MNTRAKSFSVPLLMFTWLVQLEVFFTKRRSERDSRTNGCYAVKVYSNPALLTLKDYERQKNKGWIPCLILKPSVLKMLIFGRKNMFNEDERVS